MSFRDAMQSPPATVSSLNPWQTHTVEIKKIEEEVEQVATYHLGFRDEQTAGLYRFQPGQFNMLYLPGAGEIPISLSENPQATETWAHTIRLAGNVTRTLATLQVGETLGLRGPFGAGWPIEECAGRDVIIVAGGIGLAPLRPAIYALLNQRARYGQLNLLYGARSPATILYTREFPNWDRQQLLGHCPL